MQYVFGFPAGRKCYSVTFPLAIYSDWNYAKNALRGLVDTDGSVFVSKKPGILEYPSLEITTVSRSLAEQVHHLLSTNGFRVAKIRNSSSKLSKVPSYKVALFGWKNLLHWYKEIGFSNPVKRQKAEGILIAKYGNL